MKYNKGDIIEGTDRTPETAKHPIVFISEYEEGLFLGVMLTHRKNGNIRLADNHFAQKPESDSAGDSFFVNRVLIKAKEWGPFSLTGKLSETGIEFIEKSLSSKDPIWWDELIRDLK